ncbi:MAG: class I SAM-dependent methyltransferase [Sedimentisphaerales bacterium]|nr:class I SAM-dependent methyltransferase [Sedimentisphaerales bacterium]
MSKHEMDLLDKPSGYYQSNREDMLQYVLPGTKTSLEFGCGCGGFSALVKEKYNAETWAVEINEEAAHEAEKKLDKVINSDADESLENIPEHYFDCIILFDILEHLLNPSALLSALKNKLSDKGIIIASIPNIRYYRTFVDLVIHGNWDYKDHGILDRTHLRFFTYKSIVKMLNFLNFEILVLEGIHPTSSRTFKILNLVLLNSISDIRYKHFAMVVKPQ